MQAWTDRLAEWRDRLLTRARGASRDVWYAIALAWRRTRLPDRASALGEAIARRRRSLAWSLRVWRERRVAPGSSRLGERFRGFVARRTGDLGALGRRAADAARPTLRAAGKRVREADRSSERALSNAAGSLRHRFREPLRAFDRAPMGVRLAQARELWKESVWPRYGVLAFIAAVLLVLLIRAARPSPPPSATDREMNMIRGFVTTPTAKPAPTRP